jgi:hypothetical protein
VRSSHSVIEATAEYLIGVVDDVGDGLYVVAATVRVLVVSWQVPSSVFEFCSLAGCCSGLRESNPVLVSEALRCMKSHGGSEIGRTTTGRGVGTDTSENIPDRQQGGECVADALMAIDQRGDL